MAVINHSRWILRLIDERKRQTREEERRAKEEAAGFQLGPPKVRRIAQQGSRAASADVKGKFKALFGSKIAQKQFMAAFSPTTKQVSRRASLILSALCELAKKTALVERCQAMEIHEGHPLAYGKVTGARYDDLSCPTFSSLKGNLLKEREKLALVLQRHVEKLENNGAVLKPREVYTIENVLRNSDELESVRDVWEEIKERLGQRGHNSQNDTNEKGVS